MRWLIPLILVIMTILLTPVLVVEPVQALSCEVPTDYPDVTAALSGGCTVINFVSDVVEDSDITLSLTGGQIIINGNGYRWIYNDPSPSVYIFSGLATLDFVIRDIEAVMAGGNPTNYFISLVGDVDVRVENFRFTAVTPGIFGGPFYIRVYGGVDHVYNFSNVVIDIPLAGYAYTGIYLMSQADARLFRVDGLESIGAGTAIYLYSSGYPLDVYIRDVRADGLVSLYVLDSLTESSIVVQDVEAIYTRFMTSAIHIAVTRNEPSIMVSNVVVEDGRTGGVTVYAFESNATVLVEDVRLSTSTNNPWVVSLYSYGPTPLTTPVGIDAEVRNVYGSFPTTTFARCVNIVSRDTVNSFSVSGLSCTGAWWGLYLESWSTTFNRLVLRDATISAVYRGVEIRMNHNAITNANISDIYTSVPTGLDALFRVNKFLISYQAEIRLDIYRWFVEDDVFIDLLFSVIASVVPGSLGIRGEVAYSVVDRVSLSDATYVNFTETVMREDLSIFSTYATSYSRWTLAVETLSNYLGAPAPFIPVDYYLDGVKLATVQSSISGLSLYSFEYRLGDDPVTELLRIGVSGPGTPILNIYSDLGITTTLPYWYGRITLRVDAIGLVANGFSQELGLARLVIGGTRAYLYGYYYDEPIDLDWSSPSTRIEIYITEVRGSPYYAVLRGLMRIDSGLVETVIYVNIMDRSVWIPGPIRFMGWF